MLWYTGWCIVAFSEPTYCGSDRSLLGRQRKFKSTVYLIKKKKMFHCPKCPRIKWSHPHHSAGLHGKQHCPGESELFPAAVNMLLVVTMPSLNFLPLVSLAISSWAYWVSIGAQVEARQGSLSTKLSFHSDYEWDLLKFRHFFKNGIFTWPLNILTAWACSES